MIATSMPRSTFSWPGMAASQEESSSFPLERRGSTDPRGRGGCQRADLIAKSLSLSNLSRINAAFSKSKLSAAFRISFS